MNIVGKEFKNKNILVTGGTGFIGSHLVERLIKLQANVITTSIEDLPHSYFETRKLAKTAEVIDADVSNFEAIDDIIAKHKIECIFHLAAQPLVEVAFSNPKQTLYTNILGTINILESARLNPQIKAVVVASSDKAYGKLKENKYKETDSLRGDHPYEVSKSAADLISYSYFKTYGLPVVITRFGNIYGEGDLNFSRIIPGIMKAIIKDEILEIRSDGKYIRDYLYVGDVVEGYLLLAQNISKIKGEAYNFGSKETLSVLDLLKLTQLVLRKKIKYKILSNAKNEIPYQSLDYSKIKNTFGWNPSHRIASTMSSIYKWYGSALE